MGDAGNRRKERVRTMIEIIGYMIVAYGCARLIQVSADKDTPQIVQVFGILGVAALIILGVMLSNQASEIGNLGQF